MMLMFGLPERQDEMQRLAGTTDVFDSVVAFRKWRDDYYPWWLEEKHESYLTHCRDLLKSWDDEGVSALVDEQGVILEDVRKRNKEAWAACDKKNKGE